MFLIHIIQLLGPRKSYLKLPDKLIRIAPIYRRTKTSHRSGHNDTVSYYQDVYDEQAWDADKVHHNGQGELEDSPPPSRRKTILKGKSKTTLLDIKTEEDVNSNKKTDKERLQ